jgi:hypothetical protein
MLPRNLGTVHLGRRAPGPSTPLPPSLLYPRLHPALWIRERRSHGGTYTTPPWGASPRRSGDCGHPRRFSPPANLLRSSMSPAGRVRRTWRRVASRWRRRPHNSIRRSWAWLWTSSGKGCYCHVMWWKPNGRRQQLQSKKWNILGAREGVDLVQVLRRSSHPQWFSNALKLGVLGLDHIVTALPISALPFPRCRRPRLNVKVYLSDLNHTFSVVSVEFLARRLQLRGKSTWFNPTPTPHPPRKIYVF